MSTVAQMPPKRRRPWVGFAFFGVLAILGLFVLHGIAAGVTLLAAMLILIFACIYALHGGVADDRTGLSGWFGGWF